MQKPQEKAKAGQKNDGRNIGEPFHQEYRCGGSVGDINPLFNDIGLKELPYFPWCDGQGKTTQKHQ